MKKTIFILTTIQFISVLIEILLSTYSDFVNDYFNARIIHDEPISLKIFYKSSTNYFKFYSLCYLFFLFLQNNYSGE